MNKKILENALENVFNKVYEDMKNETRIIIDGEESLEMIKFDRVKDHCSYIIRLIIDMIGEEQK